MNKNLIRHLVPIIFAAILFLICCMLMGCGDDGSNAGQPNSNRPTYFNGVANNQYNGNGNVIPTTTDPGNGYDEPMGDDISDVLGIWSLSFNFQGQNYNFVFNFYEASGDTARGTDPLGNPILAKYSNGAFAFVQHISAKFSGGYLVTIYGNSLEGCFYPYSNGQRIDDECSEVSGYQL